MRWVAPLGSDRGLRVLDQAYAGHHPLGRFDERSKPVALSSEEFAQGQVQESVSVRRDEVKSHRPGRRPVAGVLFCEEPHVRGGSTHEILGGLGHGTKGTRADGPPSGTGVKARGVVHEGREGDESVLGGDVDDHRCDRSTHTTEV